MTGIQECFSDYQEERMNFQITMGNKAKCTPVGKGAIVFQTETGEWFRATNILHVPRLGMNLLSVSQLQSNGYDVFFIKEKVYVKHSNWKKKVQIGIRRVPDLIAKRDDVCKGCALGKYAKAVFPRSNNRSKSVLGLIHSDIYGPMSTKSLSGAEYFVTFIDNHSKKTWIHFLKTKDEVFNRFKEFKALVENLIGKKIEVLRSNNGGEYVDKDFTNLR
eukprot:PITA_30001